LKWHGIGYTTTQNICLAFLKHLRSSPRSTLQPYTAPATASIFLRFFPSLHNHGNRDPRAARMTCARPPAAHQHAHLSAHASPEPGIASRPPPEGQQWPAPHANGCGLCPQRRLAGGSSARSRGGAGDRGGDLEGGEHAADTKSAGRRLRHNSPACTSRQQHGLAW